MCMKPTMTEEERMLTLEEKVARLQFDVYALQSKMDLMADRKTEPTISKMEQVEDEPQTELVRVKYHCINCAENGSYKCSKCDGEMYYKYDKDEPQTERRKNDDHGIDVSDSCRNNGR